MSPPDPLAPLIAAAVHDLLGTLLPLTILLIALTFVLKALFKGRAGERRVARRLRHLGLPCLHDIVTQAEDGSLTQIDHLALTAEGPLAIETKNFAGSIYGQQQDQEWTQAQGKAKSRFQNPLRQNFKHTAALRHQLGIEVRGLVVFVGTAKFPKGLPEDVVAFADLDRRLKSLGTPSPAQIVSPAWQAAARIAEAGTGLHRAHLAGLRARHGRDLRAPVGLALAGLAAAIFIAFRL